MSRKISTLAALALLAGCAVGPDYRRPEFALPAQYEYAKADTQTEIGRE